jgi:RNA polymerase sigma factor (sigma-70 family)
LCRSSLPRDGAAPTDGQLLETFLRDRDGLALEALVRRHAPMVWGVCRRALAHHDAEDAFQATFLVLVRKAASLRSPELLPNWLYRVACQTARKARQSAAKRSAREKQVRVMPEPPTDPQGGAPEPDLSALLDEELSRLPEKYRIAVVLCDVQGRTRHDAAQQLGLPEGTVASRLVRARALLARRLLRRGLGVSAASLATTLPQQAASGSVPAALLANTIQATARFAAGGAAAGAVSAQVAALTEGVLRTMALAKHKARSLVLLIAALVLSGGMAAYLVVANRPPEKPFVPPQNPAAEKLPLDAVAALAGPVLVVTASYPGANAQVVADTVAAPIEKLTDEEAEGLVRIESTSDNDGNYTAHLYFKPKTDLESARKDVERTVWRAEPVLPAEVLRNKVSVKKGKAKAVANQVAIVVIDRFELGLEELHKRASAAVKRLEAEHALTKPQVFPGDDVKLLYFDVDWTKCESLGVTRTDVAEALQAADRRYRDNPLVIPDTRAPPDGNLEDLKKVVVRGKVTLGDVVIMRELLGPAAVYRVDGFPAARITGAPPDGKSVAAAAAKCVDLTEDEVTRLDRPGYRGFAVKNLSAK